VPPLINSDRSRISLATRDVLVEVTGTDAAKVGIALNMVVAGFSRYCEAPYTVESVEVVLAEGARVVTPDLAERLESVSMAYIRRLTGLPLSAEEACRLLARMLVEAAPSSAAGDAILVRVPAVRPDILHACDIMEDVAIAYGFNNIPKLVPTTAGFGAPLPINKLGDMLRREVALAGFSEVLTFTLCSHAENFAKLRRSDDGSEAVLVGNPKTSDFEVVQTSLIPQTLKTLASNKKMALPIKIFQVLDVVLKTDRNDVGARNERRLCAAYCSQSSGLEVIHGLLDRVMLMLDVRADAATGYSIREASLPTFFEGRQAEVLYKGLPIGAFGIVHPLVSQAFEAPYVTSLLELNIEPFL
jgi:phenylalanyl-tRNA synthetase beta chain